MNPEQLIKQVLLLFISVTLAIDIIHEQSLSNEVHLLLLYMFLYRNTTLYVRSYGILLLLYGNK